MRDHAITFRCFSRSEPTPHSIKVEPGNVLCSCNGTNWCSHIDATLLAGEREMVPFEDWDIADFAQRLASTWLQPPQDWKASWRDDKIWRGLATRRLTKVEQAVQAGRPMICFIGSGSLGSRADYLEEARDLGWEPMTTIHPDVTLVVHGPRGLASRAGQKATELNLPCLSFDEWDEHAYDITEQVLDRIEALTLRPIPRDEQAA